MLKKKLITPLLLLVSFVFIHFYNSIIIFATTEQDYISTGIETRDVPELSDIISEAVCVIDADTGQVLVQKNMDRILYPASITKILTVALALENEEESSTITVTEEDTNLVANSTHIALTQGEQLTLEQAAYATMLASANDAANAIGSHISGNIAEFGKLMTQKANEIGAIHSNFTNPSGLPNDQHYSTAYDMALITRYALSVEGFMKYFSAIEYTIPPTNKQPAERNLGTYHHMIVESLYQYDGAIGGKLGWTDEAMHTSVTYATRNGRNLIAVTMKSAQKFDKYVDTEKLFDYCFANFTPFSIEATKFPKVNTILMYGNVYKGVMEVFLDKNIDMLLHNDIAKDDLVLMPYVDKIINQLSLKEPYVVVAYKDGEERIPLFNLPLEYNQISSVSGQVVEAFGSLSDNQTITPQNKLLDQLKSVLIGVVIVVASLILLVLIIRNINKMRYAMKKRRRKKRLERSRRRYYNNKF